MRVDVLAHETLTERDLEQLRHVFDREYLTDFGAWAPEQPYGYAAHDLHVIARLGGEIVGHVGWARRIIGVGDSDVTIAGVGGVLISETARGQRLGGRLMARAARSMADSEGIDFGYLGCREEVVPFYVSCGWQRISAAERSLGRDGAPVEAEPGPPLLILPVRAESAAWPTGTVDLRGRAW